MYPETVGRTLEEVEEIFNRGHTFSAWKIGEDVERGGWEIERFRGKSFFYNSSLMTACMLTVY
jgi:hypothetical protein